MLIIGIDPGISGSICFFKDGKILDVIEMPTMTEGKKNKRQVNGAQIYNEISKKLIKFSCLSFRTSTLFKGIHSSSVDIKLLILFSNSFLTL